MCPAGSKNVWRRTLSTHETFKGSQEVRTDEWMGRCCDSEIGSEHHGLGKCLRILLLYDEEDEVDSDRLYHA